MNDKKGSFNVLASVEKHIEALKPLLPKQAVICIGEYPIKILLKEKAMSGNDRLLSVLVEKTSDDVYRWIPRGFSPNLILGFEDSKVNTHFWYNVAPYIAKDEVVLAALKKKSLERLHGATIVSSVWDGIGSAFLPELIGEFKAENINSIGMAVLPSDVQTADAHFNSYAAIQRCLTIDDATVLLVDRDHLEAYEGVDRKGSPLKGNIIVNYLVDFLLGKDTLVEEISELSKTFNVEMYTFLLVTGASYKIYGSLENMLNTALLKQFLTFDLSTASVVYVLLRMPSTLKDKLPRGKMELAIANWFKPRVNLQSIYITEPIYTEDPSDRIDAVLFIGGFDTSKMFSDYERRSELLKKQAVDRGYMTEDWKVPVKVEIPEVKIAEIIQPPPSPEPEAQPAPEAPQVTELVPTPEASRIKETEPALAESPTVPEAPKTEQTMPVEPAPIETAPAVETPIETPVAEAAPIEAAPAEQKVADTPTASVATEPKAESKPKRTLRIRRLTSKKS